MAKTIPVTAQAVNATPTANNLQILEANVGNLPGYNEQDLIKQLMDTSEFSSSRLKGKLRTSVGGAAAPEAEGASEVASRAGQSALETSTKLCQRIWAAYVKYIRAQCNKDRVVDSLLYGFFFKKGAEADDAAP